MQKKKEKKSIMATRQIKQTPTQQKCVNYCECPLVQKIKYEKLSADANDIEPYYLFKHRLSRANSCKPQNADNEFAFRGQASGRGAPSLPQDDLAARRARTRPFILQICAGSCLFTAASGSSVVCGAGTGAGGNVCLCCPFCCSVCRNFGPA